MSGEHEATPAPTEIEYQRYVVSTQLGASDAMEAALTGLLKAFRHFPGVRECVMDELLRLEAILLAECTNVPRGNQFDKSVAEFRSALENRNG